MTVASRSGDRLPDAEQSRANEFSGSDPVAEGNLQPVTAAQIPSGGDAGLHHGKGSLLQSCPDPFSWHLELLLGPEDRGIQVEVDMTVDQARNQANRFIVLKYLHI